MAEGIDIEFNKRVVPNFISNIIFFILNIIVGLFLTPFFLDTLGPSAYGLVPLATSVTTYVILIINSLNTTISRYLTLDLQKNQSDEANGTFNTAIFGSLGVILVLTPFILFFATLTPSIFDIGSSAAIDVVFLFSLVFVAALVRTFGSNFMVVLFAYNRLDRRNYVNCANLLIQIISIVFIFLIFGPSLPAVGASYLIAAVLSVILAYYLSRKTCNILSISPKYFSKNKFKDIASTALWVTLNDVGYFIRTQISLILVNIILGPVANTEFSLVLTWATLVNSISAIVLNLFVPMIYSYRSKGDTVGMVRFTATAMRLSGFIVALPIALICIFSSQLLTIWVGGEYAHLGTLFLVLVLPQYIPIIASCAATIYIAQLRVRLPTIMNMVAAVINIFISLILSINCNLGLYGVAFGSVLSAIVYAVFITLYGPYTVNTGKFDLIRSLLPGLIASLILVSIGLIVTKYLAVEGIFGLIIAGFLISLVYSIIICKIGFRASDKLLIRNLFPGFINKLIPKWLL